MQQSRIDTQNGTAPQPPAQNVPEIFILGHERQMNAVLLGWAAGSMVTGALLSQEGRFSRAVGGQFFVWGLIDALLGGFGLRNNLQKQARANSGDYTQAEHDDQAKQLERILWVNAGLNVLYLIGGLWLFQQDKV